MADVVSDSTVINADPDSIMDVIADFESYPEWQDEVQEVEVLQTDDDGWATRVRFLVAAKLGKAGYVLDYSYAPDSMRWELVESDTLKRNDGLYRLTDRGDGTTEVRYELALEAAMKVPGMVKRQVEKRIISTALGALKRRVEGA